jgi:membrane fusion protein, copper/silver efflux system
MSTEDKILPQERPSSRRRVVIVLLLLFAFAALAYFAVKPVKLAKVPAAEKQPEMAQQMATSPDAKGSPASGAIFVSPQKQQLIGMHAVAAGVQALVKDIRTVGKVSFDETKVTHIHTRVSGYIEEVYADFIGKAVNLGDPLFTIYSPDLVSTQQDYLLALKSRNILKNSAFPDISRGGDNLLAAARERLRLWDVSAEEIERLEKDGTVKQAIAVTSPVSGVVTQRAAYHHGTYVDPTMELFTIVDLSRVWVLGEVYEADLPFVQVGQSVDVSLPNSGSAKTLRGRISFITPLLDPKTRSAQIRVEFENPDLALKPDMYADVLFHADLGSRLVVPQDAVLNTGTEQYVFVDLGQGYVEPRRVEMGPAAGDSVSILKGLKSGERVVTAANFVIDAESRLKGAFANMGQPSAPPEARAVPTEQKLLISILEPTQGKVGPNSVRLSVKDSSGKPLDGANVAIKLFMPQMGAMAPMSADAELQGVGGGEYTGTVNVPMAWTWQTTITVRKAKQVLGSTETTLTAR